MDQFSPFLIHVPVKIRKNVITLFPLIEWRTLVISDTEAHKLGHYGPSFSPITGLKYSEYI